MTNGQLAYITTRLDRVIELLEHIAGPTLPQHLWSDERRQSESQRQQGEGKEK